MAANTIGSPIALGIDLFARHATRQQGMSLRAHIAGFAKDIGKAFSRRQGEALERVENDRAGSWCCAVAMKPAQCDLCIRGERLFIRRATNLEKDKSFGARRQRLGQSKDRRQSGLIAREKM